MGILMMDMAPMTIQACGAPNAAILHLDTLQLRFSFVLLTNLDCLFVLSFPYDSSTHNLYYLSSILFCSGYFCVWLLALYLDCLFALSFSYDSSTHYLDYFSSILFCGGYFCVWPVDLADLNFVYAA